MGCLWGLTTFGAAIGARALAALLARRRGILDYIIRSADDKARLWRVIDGLAPKVWRVSITAYRSRRSNDQNRLAWKLYNAVAAETGYTPDEVHSLFKQKFGEPKVVKIGGVEVTEYTTRDRDVGWFSDYLDRCQAFAASELGVTIG